jgi:hypothetical protein
MGHNIVSDITAYLLVPTIPAAALLLWEHRPFRYSIQSLDDLSVVGPLPLGCVL